METIILSPRFEEDYPTKRIEFVDQNNKVICLGFFVPFQFIICPYYDEKSYDPENKINKISTYSQNIDEIVLMSLKSDFIRDGKNIISVENKEIHKIKKRLLYFMVQDAIRSYEVAAFEQGIHIIVYNGFSDDREMIESSPIYRYVRYHYSQLLGKYRGLISPKKNILKEVLAKDNGQISMFDTDEDNKMDLELAEEYEEEDPYNEFEEEDNPAFCLADDPEKGLNFRFE